MADEVLIPEVADVPAVIDLNDRLTGEDALKRVEAALRANVYVLQPDEAMTIAQSDGLVIEDADDYRRGYDLLHELAAIEERVEGHYARFAKPLNYLVGVVRGLKKPQSDPVGRVKEKLALRLGKWKADSDRADRIRAQEEQRARDIAAQAAQVARAETLDRVAEMQQDPVLADSIRREAEAVRDVTVSAAPVEVQQTAPKDVGGHSRTQWKCEFQDLKELLRAYVDGRVRVLDEDGIKAGLQSWMDRQATNLQKNMTQAFPGTVAREIPKAVPVKPRGGLRRT